MKKGLFVSINKYLAFAFLLAFVFLLLLFIFRDDFLPQQVKIPPQAATSQKTP